ncbi:SemiSWEET family sugar transporter [Candidatus Nucleicultrix amoebiphila]|nr:SemiSWEET family transporter [Candidatus Nucleicultrix amoebiphila]
MNKSHFSWYTRPYFRMFYEKYMMVVGLIGQLLFYLQAIKIYHTRSAEDLSLTGFLIAFFSLISWLFYGIILRNKVLIFVNITGSFGALLVVLLKILVDHKIL